MKMMKSLRRISSPLIVDLRGKLRRAMTSCRHINSLLSKKMKVQINVPVPQQVREESDSTHKFVEEDRKLQVYLKPSPRTATHTLHTK
jgi:hypothetical protein